MTLSPSLARRATLTVTFPLSLPASLPTSSPCARWVGGGRVVQLLGGKHGSIYSKNATWNAAPHVQAKIQPPLAWAARHRMPLEVVRLEDVQPPDTQVALVQRLAAEYGLPLAGQHAGDAAAAGGRKSGSRSDGSLTEHGAAALRDVVRDARDWWKFDFDLPMRRAGWVFAGFNYVACCSKSSSLCCCCCCWWWWRCCCSVVLSCAPCLTCLAVVRAVAWAPVRRSVYLHPELMDGKPINPEFSTALRSKVAAVSPLVDALFEARLGYEMLQVPAHAVRAHE